MAINLTSPTTFTSAVLIGDTSQTTGGSVDGVPALTAVAGVPVSAALEIQSTSGAFLMPRMTTTQANALTTKANGMQLYDNSLNVVKMYISSAYSTVITANSAGLVTGINTLTLGTSATTAGVLNFKNASNANTATIQSGVSTGNITWTLPTADATVASAPLVSNAAGVLSFATTSGLYKSVPLTDANIKAMYGAPVSVLAAPGAGLAYAIDRWALNVVVGTDPYTGGGIVDLQYGATVHGAGPFAATTMADTIVTAGTLGVNKFLQVGTAVNGGTEINSASAINTAIYISNATGAFVTGGSTNGSAVLHIWYSIIPVI